MNHLRDLILRDQIKMIKDRTSFSLRFLILSLKNWQNSCGSSCGGTFLGSTEDLDFLRRSLVTIKSCLDDEAAESIFSAKYCFLAYKIHLLALFLNVMYMSLWTAKCVYRHSRSACLFFLLASLTSLDSQGAEGRFLIRRVVIGAC